MKSSKSEKAKAIERRSCLQQKSRLRDGQPTQRNARTLTQNDYRASADSSETDERDSDEYDRRDVTDERDSDAIDSGGEEDSSDVILAFINSDEEQGHSQDFQRESHRVKVRVLTRLSLWPRYRQATCCRLFG